jgi:hypothetical protein
MNSPFKEIDPQPMTDAVGQDVLQSMLKAGARRGYESRFDNTEPLQSLLHQLYILRQQADAEEWPVASEPIVDDLPGASKVLPQTTGDAPAGGEVALRLHHIAVIGIGVLLSTWWFVRSIGLSINQ